ncbi:MAG: hypothetical protein HY900_08030 [Deltaproteobacteria bacterium]|nr:hypothetical protein [Deltaproteobacteria bacterium]
MARHPSLTGLFRLALFSALVLCSGALFYSTGQNAKTAASLADQALESTALALAASAENELRGGGVGIGRILSDRVVAYALLVDPQGRVRFHTNPGLVGSTVREPDRAEWFRSGKAAGRRVTLGTGLPAYEYRYPLRAAGRGELRLVLHTVDVDRILDQSKRLWWVAAGVAAALWAVGFALDRAFRRQLRSREEGLRQEKLAVIGQMTATLAHEIRNALGSIKGFAQWVDEKLAPADGLKVGTAAILQGTGRIESLVEDLLAYSREEGFRPGPVALDGALRDALSGFDCSRCSVELEATEGLRAFADEEKLRRVLTNGIRNALEAMGGGGALRLVGVDRGRNVEVRIEDRGPGVPPDAGERIFTPFFTTKTSGTGLGLAYCRKVVEGMGGRVELKNRKSGGARLCVLLPKHTGT